MSLKWNGNVIEDLVEKPVNFLSNDAVIGLYIFDSNFCNHFKNLQKSNRGEFEIIDIIKEYNLENTITQIMLEGELLGLIWDLVKIFLIQVSLSKLFRIDKVF